jgi:autotransporter translocation and assembly factor TamB
MRRIARLLPYIALLLVILIVVAYFWRSGPLRRQLRVSIADQLARQTGRKVSVGDVSLSPTGQVIIRDLTIQNADGAALLVAPEAAVSLGKPWSLLSPSTAAESLRGITLRGPTITAVREISRKWNIEDLLKKRPTGPSRFTGDVNIEKGRLVVVDRVGNTSTTIEGVELRLQQPGPGQVSFTFRAKGSQDSFDSLEASGSSDSQARTADISAKISNADLGYAFARLPSIPFLAISAGRADANATVKLIPGLPDKVGAGVLAECEVRGATVSFPWLKKPITDVKGKVRFEDGDIHLDNVAGSLVGAPVEAQGVISNLASPVLDIKYKTWGLRFAQLKSLMPKLLAPVTLTLPSPLTIEAQVKGPASDPVVEGKARVKVIKFRLIPWHDAVADFTYTKKRLHIQNLRAHGSPRQLNADITIEWGKGLKALTTAKFGLVNVPVRDFAQMIGVGEVPLDGIASFTGTASLDSGRAVNGTFVIREAVAREVRLGEVAGDVTYDGQTVTIKRGRIKGPAGEGKFSATVSLPDKYTLEADLSRVDLSQIGGQIGQPKLSGEFPVTVRASGALRGLRGRGEAQIGPGRLQGRAFESVETGFDFSPAGARLSNVRIALPHGTAQGELAIREWQRRKQRAPLSGRLTFDGISPADWLPVRFAAFVAGRVGGEAEISGEVGDPTAIVNLRSISVTAPGLTFPSGSARILYQHGAYAIQGLNLEETRTGLKLASETTPTGVAYTVSGDQVDLGYLSAGIGKRYGLAIDGKAKVRATVTGPLRLPTVDFSVSAEAVNVNDLPFTDISISGRFANGLLSIRPPPQGKATLRQAGSSIAIGGTVSLDPSGPVNLAVEARNVDILTVQSIIDRASWHLGQRGARFSPQSPYFSIPRPFGGRLDAQVTITGATAQPEATATVKVTGLKFGRPEINEPDIESIEGKLTVGLSLQSYRTAALRKLTIENLKASQGPALAEVKGEIEPGGPMSVAVAVFNLDLAILRPWLQYEVGLNGLKLDGEATINLDIGGTTDDPALDGDISVDSLALGPLFFENARAFPIKLRKGVVTIEELTFSHYPMLAEGKARIPLDSRLGLPSLDLKITRGQFTPIGDKPALSFDANLYLRGKTLYLSEQPPEAGGPPRNGLRDASGKGMVSAQGTANLTTFSPAGLGENQFNITAELNNYELNLPGLIEGKLNGRVALTNSPSTGGMVLATPDLAALPAVAAEPVGPDGLPRVSIHVRDVSVPEVAAEIGQKSGAAIAVDGEVLETVSLSRDDTPVSLLLQEIYDKTGVFWWRSADGSYHLSAAPPPESHPIVISQATLHVPRGLPPAKGGLLFAPALRLRVALGDEVQFEYGSGSRPTQIKVAAGGYLYLGGQPSASGIVLEGEAESRDGTLSFPNGTLTLRRGMARMTLSPETVRTETARLATGPDPGKYLTARPRGGWIDSDAGSRVARPPRIWISAEADGRIGDYYVSLNPIGQIYPPPSAVPGARELGYAVNAASIPPLDEPYVLALLAGPIMAPGMGAESSDIARLLSFPGAASGPLGGVTGVALPTLGSLSPASPQLSFAVPFQGPVRLRVGERLFRRVMISYLSPLSGIESRALTVTYEVTPRWSFGWNFNPIDVIRWEAQAFFPF